MKILKYLIVTLVILFILNATTLGQEDDELYRSYTFIYKESTKADSLSPSSAELYQLGLKYLAEGNFIESAIKFNLVVEENKDFAPACYLGAITYWLRRDTAMDPRGKEYYVAKAKELLKKALELDPINKEVLELLSRIEPVVVKKIEEEAVKVEEVNYQSEEFILEAKIKGKNLPSDILTIYSEGLDLLAKGEFDKAEGDFRRATIKENSSPEPYYLWAVTVWLKRKDGKKSELGYLREAEVWINKALERDPEHQGAEELLNKVEEEKEIAKQFLRGPAEKIEFKSRSEFAPIRVLDKAKKIADDETIRAMRGAVELYAVEHNSYPPDKATLEAQLTKPVKLQYYAGYDYDSETGEIAPIPPEF